MRSTAFSPFCTAWKQDGEAGSRKLGSQEWPRKAGLCLMTVAATTSFWVVGGGEPGADLWCPRLCVPGPCEAERQA